MTKYENFYIPNLFNLIANDKSNLNVRLLLTTQVLLPRLCLSFSIRVDLLVHRFILLFQGYLGAHSYSWSKILAIGSSISHRAYLEGFFHVFEI